MKCRIWFLLLSLIAIGVALGGFCEKVNAADTTPPTFDMSPVANGTSYGQSVYNTTSRYLTINFSNVQDESDIAIAQISVYYLGCEAVADPSVPGGTRCCTNPDTAICPVNHYYDIRFTCPKSGCSSQQFDLETLGSGVGGKTYVFDLYMCDSVGNCSPSAYSSGKRLYVHYNNPPAFNFNSIPTSPLYTTTTNVTLGATNITSYIPVRGIQISMNRQDSLTWDNHRFACTNSGCSHNINLAEVTDYNGIGIYYADIYLYDQSNTFTAQPWAFNKRIAIIYNNPPTLTTAAKQTANNGATNVNLVGGYVKNGNKLYISGTITDPDAQNFTVSYSLSSNTTPGAWTVCRSASSTKKYTGKYS